MADCAGELAAAGERRSHRLPPVSKTCPPLRVEAAPLLISGIREGDVLRRLPLAKTLDLRVVTQGGEGTQWWFLNGDRRAVLSPVSRCC